MKSLYFTNILLIINYIWYVDGNDVLGCGGFLKSHVQIDFSKVEVKLYVKILINSMIKQLFLID